LRLETRVLTVKGSWPGFKRFWGGWFYSEVIRPFLCRSWLASDGDLTADHNLTVPPRFKTVGAGLPAKTA
jgi:hypothetical protein